MFCRDETYVNLKTTIALSYEPDVGNYVAFSGTSMAAPHVAGVAALVGAADTAAPDTEIAQALRTGVSLAVAGRPTVSGGIVDAVKAIDAALAPPAAAGAEPPPAAPTPAAAEGPRPGRASRARPASRSTCASTGAGAWPCAWPAAATCAAG